MLQPVYHQLRDPTPRRQADWAVSLVHKLKGQASSKLRVDKDRSGDHESESSPRRSTDDVCAEIIWQPNKLQRGCEDEVAGMEPQLLPKRHYHALL